MYASGSAPGILCGLPKIHIPSFKNLFQLGPIFASYNSPSFKISKYLTKTLAPLNVNECTAENSQHLSIFVANIPNADSCYMVFIDVFNLVTKVPPSETISIILNHFFNQSYTFMNMTCDVFKKLLELSVKSFFLFDGYLYKQVEGLSMGLPLGPTFANIFMCFNGIICLSDCAASFKPVFYKRYIDDVFLLFQDQSESSLFSDYINGKYPNIKYSIEREVNGTLGFLDCTVTKKGNKLVTPVYRKPTFFLAGYKLLLLLCLSFQN